MPSVFKKVPAQALYFALLIATLGVLTLTAVLLWQHTSSFFGKQSSIATSLHYTNKELFLHKIKETYTGTKDTLAVNNDNLTHKFQQKYYGCWIRSFSGVQQKNFNANTIGLVGTSTSDRTPNFYLKNSNSPLILVGNTRLSGQIYIPSSGIRTGTIHGNYFNGNRLVQGYKHTSKDNLPKLQSQWLTYLRTLSKEGVSDNYKAVSFSNSMKNSFFNSSFLLRGNHISLQACTLSGNIIVKATSKITVFKSAKLTDVILIAPEIELKSNVKGRFQCIASEKISVGKNCSLSYPSAIVVDNRYTNKEDEHLKSDISIEKGTEIHGSIVFLKKKAIKPFRNSNTNVFLDERTNIVGQVYCEGNLQLNGAIRGSVYTEQCLVDAYGSRYINHLYNATIAQFPVDNYAGIPLVGNEKNTLAKWLY